MVLYYTGNLDLLECGYIGNYITKFEDNKIYSSFYLKEENLNLKYIQEKSIVEMKANSIKINGQVVLVILFRFAGSNKFIYGRIYNKNSDLDKEHLQMLVFQDTIPICFVDSNNKIIATTLVENDLRNSIKDYIIKKRVKYSPSYDFEDRKCKLKELWMNA
ncbi:MULTISPECIES: hypothetical protein [Clostridium]|uniref:hypothetical protein n=1 Tax=Clostridium TaxID=1485 RepID=UPI002149DD4D|nr:MULTISPECIES: hypothetical protein [Clostridium]MCR1952672.1 hypothetical protein [Clostridium sp. DSM 100503]MDI9215493.1 hypothetical protein [Clostridium tertium]